MQVKKKKAEPIILNVKRVAMTLASIVSAGLLIISALLYNSGVIKGVNPKVDALADQMTEIFAIKSTFEGEFFDRNSNPLTQSAERGTAAEILYPHSLSYLIGYNSEIYGLSGLRDRYRDYLFDGKRDDRGADINLTLDIGLQEFAQKILDDAAVEGSISILNAETGEILAMVGRSHPAVDFCANEINSHFQEYSSISGFFLNPATTAEDAPGSCFKLITAASLLENDMSAYTIDDFSPLTVTEEYSIHNFGNRYYGEGLNLERALEKSANTYFASAGLALGSVRLQSTAERFLYGQDIELDFTCLHSNFDHGLVTDKNLLAQTAFGQGRTVVSPLQMAMSMQCIMNKGKMLEPYIVERIVNNDKTKYKGTTEILTHSISSKTAEALCDMLHNNAVSYGYGDEELFGYVMAKTGTADTHRGTNHIYLQLGQRCTSGGCYSIIIDHRNSEAASGVLNKAGQALLTQMAYYDSIAQNGGNQ